MSRHYLMYVNTNMTKKLIDDDLFLKKNSDSFSRFILNFGRESPTLQHFEAGLQALRILPGGRLDAFCNSGLQ